jgi:hypothetical protein
LISFPSALKSRLRGDDRRQARPKILCGSGFAKRMKRRGTFLDSISMLISGSSVIPLPLATICTIVEARKEHISIDAAPLVANATNDLVDACHARAIDFTQSVHPVKSVPGTVAISSRSQNRSATQKTADLREFCK